MIRNRPSRATLLRAVVVGFVLVVVAVAVLVIATTWEDRLDFVWRQSRGTWAEPYVVGYALKDSRDPIDRDFAHGRFKAGDTLDRLLDSHPPTRVVHHGRYTTVSYGSGFGGTSVIARDGKLVIAVAWSCVYEHVFFNTLTAAEEAQVYASFDLALALEREKRRAPFLAVAGFGATIEPWDLLQPEPEP